MKTKTKSNAINSVEPYNVPKGKRCFNSPNFSESILGFVPLEKQIEMHARLGLLIERTRLDLEKGD
jgi:hypothetical protein